MTPACPTCSPYAQAETRNGPRAHLRNLCACNDDDCPLTSVTWREFLVRAETLSPATFPMTIPRRIEDREWARADRQLLRLLAVMARITDLVIPVEGEPEYLAIGVRPFAWHEH